MDQLDIVLVDVSSNVGSGSRGRGRGRHGGSSNGDYVGQEAIKTLYS
jgi:hypothetical protein